MEYATDDESFQKWGDLPTELQNATLDVFHLRPSLPSVATGPRRATWTPATLWQEQHQLKSLACTSRANHRLVESHASLPRKIRESNVLLCTGLGPPSESASAEEVSDWAAEHLRGIKHAVFATGSLWMYKDTSPSFATGVKLLNYMSAHPSDHSIETVTFDERIQDSTATAQGTDSKVRLCNLTRAAKGLVNSKLDKSIRLQVHSHPHKARPIASYQFGAHAPDGNIILDESSWGDGNFNQAPGFEGTNLSGDLRRRRNFDLRRGCDVAASIESFRHWCDKNFLRMSRAEEVASPGTSPTCSMVVNLHAADTPSDSYLASGADGDLPSVIKTNADVRKVKHLFQAVIDEVAAERPVGSRSSMTLNAGVCDQKAYTVEGCDDDD